MSDELVDNEGENQAVRDFLMLYGGAQGVTVGQMRKHMDRSGWSLQYCPAFARLGGCDSEHLSKAGAQIWIRHLIEMEGKAP
jgi:hypothetical protein